MSNGVYATLLEVDDTRLVFLKLNNQYVGFDVRKATFPTTRDDTSLKILIVKYVRSVGFQTKKDYLEALPGYTGDESLNILPAFVYNYFEKVQTSYSWDKDSSTHECGFDFEYLIDTGEEYYFDFLMAHFNRFIGNPANKTLYPLLTIVPTLEEIKSVFYNVPEEKLWFCKEVLEGTQYETVLC